MAQSVTRCPHCNNPLIISAQAGAAGPPWKPNGASIMHHAASMPGAPPPITQAGAEEWQRITPISKTTTDDIRASFIDSVVSAGLVMVATGSMILVLDGLTFHWGGAVIRVLLPWSLVPLSGVGMAILRYFWGMAIARRLNEIVETITGRDINQDGHIGKPESPKPHTVEVKVSNGPGRWQYEELKVEPGKLKALALAVLAGQSFTERTATKAGLTQDEFRELREQFIGRGWATWNHPTRKQQGHTLTRGGEFIIKAIANTPLPRADSTENNVHSSTQQHAARNYA